MIDLYFAPTPNGWQAAIMLEETGLNYRPVLMRLSEGDQFSPEFLAISPNAKMQGTKPTFMTFPANLWFEFKEIKASPHRLQMW